MISRLSKIRNAPPEVFHNRIVLVGIILAVWLLIKLLEIILPNKVLEALPGPFPLAMLFVFIATMSFYMVVTYLAQKWKARLKREQLIPSESLQKPSRYPLVDIFIAEHNERCVIIDTLENILKIDYPNYKIYVIDDRSTDGTVEAVKDFIKENHLADKITLIARPIEAFPGKAAALNEALRQSNGELVAVFDADARVQPDCLRLSLHYFNDPEVGAVQFQKKIRNAGFNTLAFCQDLEFAYDTYLQVGRDSLDGFVELRGSGQITTRKCLEEVGGWDERALTEDLEISTKINAAGMRIRFAPEIVAEEEAVLTTLAFIRQRRRWAEGSLRRYLIHFDKFINPKSKLSLVKRLDIIPFLSQFAIPIWVFFDVIVEIFRYVTKQPTYITTLMLASSLVSISMWISITIGIRRWRNFSTFQSIRYGVLAFSYGMAHWPPIVLWTIRKVIFGRRPTEWTKTPRMGDLIPS
ncbi:MAG: glycosyltransferase family 2 protein [Candidatus Caenarcaniphilales bacterium]|nr:glycosyltransferase family 2 protein [Candidatus Caenarcaniphilales bacterium]